VPAIHSRQLRGLALAIDTSPSLLLTDEVDQLAQARHQVPQLIVSFSQQHFAVVQAPPSSLQDQKSATLLRHYLLAPPLPTFSCAGRYCRFAGEPTEVNS